VQVKAGNQHYIKFPAIGVLQNAESVWA
jgi:hypothetical protein